VLEPAAEVDVQAVAGGSLGTVRIGRARQTTALFFAALDR
jgi:hypothetical protein